jgi:succinate dehydrogenase/fumarate reductase flavoprotein subunit
MMVSVPLLLEHAWSSNPRMLALSQVKILILGAGPTGLGAATRLQQHGEHDWLLLEQVRTRHSACAQQAPSASAAAHHRVVKSS